MHDVGPPTAGPPVGRGWLAIEHAVHLPGPQVVAGQCSWAPSHSDVPGGPHSFPAWQILGKEGGEIHNRVQQGQILLHGLRMPLKSNLTP